MKKINLVISCLWIFLWAVAFTLSSAAQTTVFNYQGRLTDAGNPANGNYDMQFKLFDTVTVGTGTQQGPTLPNPAVQVTNGNFTVQLDFGATVFDGSARYLEIAARPAGSPNPYTVLGPRIQITSAPYAINSQQLGGLPASRYVKSDANGNVAIGAGTAAHRLAVLGGPCWTGDCWSGALELDNASAIAWRANTSGTQFGIGRTNAGLFFFRTMSPLGTTTNGPIYDFKMDNNGNVGIGQIGINTDLSGAKLTVQTSGYGMAQSDGTITVSSFINSSGGWFGTKSNHPLHFYTNDSAPRMSIDTAGNVGIGSTPNGNTKLGVESSLGSTISAINSAGGTAVYGSSPSGIGIFGSSDTNYAGFFQGTVRVTGGKLQLQALGSAGSQPLCRNVNDEVATCSSSLRYKKDFHSFDGGLSFIEQLRPITYQWKADNTPDVGFGAEEVAKINPLFVTYNQKGEVEGVKYDRLSAVFVNAIKEQQQEIKAQQKLINRLQQQIDALTKIVCQWQTQAAICQEGKQ